MGLDLVLDQVVGVLADQHRIVFGDEFFGDDYDLVGHEGLSQVGRETGVFALGPVEGGVGRRQHQYRYIFKLVSLPERVRQVAAVHQRHFRVCDHQVRYVFDRQLKPFFAILTRNNFKALLRQAVGDKRALHAAVFDDEDLLALAGQGAVEHHFDTAEQFVVGDGFGEEVVGAGVETAVDVDASAAGRENQDRNSVRRFGFLDPLAHLIAVHHRHVDIANKQIGYVLDG